MKTAKTYEIEGRVQGVGFRPFVFKIACKYLLKGFVYNRSMGVYAEVEGEEEEIKKFEHELQNDPPPLARIDKIIVNSAPLKNFTDFKILKSEISPFKNTLISPDMSLCDECLEEMRDKNNRRFNYPLINCTNCGPRYSIIKTVPYDRINTSMSVFEMCEECRAEYEDPRNRRYHAQPISCPKCGPKITFVDLENGVKTDIEALEKLAEAIKSGKIAALKGMGGFHIICDAQNSATVKLLREKKRRPSKPFAILMSSIEMAKKYCDITSFEKKALLSRESPIVLVRKREDCTLSSDIAPHTDKLGIFLSYTGLLVRIAELLDRPLIATSANISGEPIITDGKELENKLKDIISSYVDFDREIINFSDDSVVQFTDKGMPIFLRLSRGIAPNSFLPRQNSSKKILSLGAHQKSSIAIYDGKNVILSPYIGDLDSVSSVEAYEKVIENFKRFYDFRPELLVCDIHPNYASSMWARRQNLPIVSVQHHYAHILAVMFEHGIDEEVLGIAWDGTGLGDDRSVWGGEFFVCDMKSYRRVFTFAPFKLLGGEKSVKNIKRIAFSILYGHKNQEGVAKYLDSFSKDERYLLEQSYEKDINASLCHSVGRLFDATAAIILGLENTTYDGESGLMLEALYDKNIKERYEIVINEKREIEYANWFIGMLQDEPRVAASKFINTLSALIVHIVRKQGKKRKVVFGGGVFQNRTLVEKTVELLEGERVEFFFARTISSNDSSIALGQMAYVLNIL
ncbi:MAG: carbamoyltransferase HypF [Campylobacteraceae bacterium]|jgi:hydrogenase maturation protein HypF|nr:carbamoyltransferase HypF [Campylobacteraceae bacterium]